VADLLELAQLIDELRRREGTEGGQRGVK
jgi:hypothetical protein